MKHTVQHTMTLAKYLRKYRHFNIDSFDRESNDSIADLSSAITSIENDCVLSFDDVLIDLKILKTLILHLTLNLIYFSQLAISLLFIIHLPLMIVG